MTEEPWTGNNLMPDIRAIEREKELLGLIEKYIEIRGWEAKRLPAVPKTGPWRAFGERFLIKGRGVGTKNYREASWGESEACRREVAGECAVREADIEWLTEGVRIWPSVEADATEADDPSNTVALLKAFVAAFSKEPA